MLAKSKEKGLAVCVGLRRQPLEGYHMGKCWTWRPAKAPDGLGTWLAPGEVDVPAPVWASSGPHRGGSHKGDPHKGSQIS